MKYIILLSILLLFVSVQQKNNTSNTKREFHNISTQDENHEIVNEKIELVFNDSTSSTTEAKLVLKDDEIFVLASYSHDLDKNGANDSIYLYQQIVNELGDFQKIKIRLDNGFEFNQENFSWIATNEKYAENKIESNYITLVEYNNTSLIICYGWPYASDPPLLMVYECKSGVVQNILNENLLLNQIILDGDTVFSLNKSYKQAGEQTEPETYFLVVTGNQYSITK